MAYTPNFNDPRVIKRLTKAYGFVRGCLSPIKQRQWAQCAIDANLGKSDNDLSAWLRQQLLICTNQSYSVVNHIAKSYKLNPTGADLIRSILKGKTLSTEVDLDLALETNRDDSFVSTMYVDGQFSGDPTKLFDYLVVKQWVDREYAAQLQSGNFKYTDKSNRLWNPLQNVRSEFRTPILASAGFKHNYDIAACAPTLIMQHAQSLGMDEYPFAITNYINDRTEVRNQIAQQCGITASQTKILINAMFCGAKLGTHSEFALFHLLDCDKTKIEAVASHSFITELKKDIKMCWSAIEPTLTRIEVTNPTTKKTRKVALNSKRKWACYFQQERSVVDCVRKYLSKTNNRAFMEHDGWKTEQPIDISCLAAYVKAETGFSIKIDYSPAGSAFSRANDTDSCTSLRSLHESLPSSVADETTQSINGNTDSIPLYATSQKSPGNMRVSTDLDQSNPAENSHLVNTPYWNKTITNQPIHVSSEKLWKITDPDGIIMIGQGRIEVIRRLIKYPNGSCDSLG